MPSSRRSLLRAGFVGLAGLMVPAARAQLEDLLGAGKRAWEREFELDPALRRALESGDGGSLDALLREATRRLGGDNVLDLAPLGQGLRQALPLLERRSATRPYASWLRTRLDYFKVAERLRETRPAPRPGPGPPPPPVRPTAEEERRAWQRQLERQPPPGDAAGWMPRLKPLFRGAGSPVELAWLAEIESSFDPQARSPAGAVGLYQLMPATAESLGLKVRPRDDRLDPEKNARAAAGYLRKLQGQFKDWRLTLAAYNAGPGRVADLLKRQQARSFDAIAPKLPAETQMYVPKFEAVLRRREGLALTAVKIPGAR